MRPSISLVLCNFMLIIASRAQGIRLEGESLAAFKIQEKNNLLMGAPGSRKLMTKAALSHETTSSSGFHGQPQKVRTNKNDNNSGADIDRAQSPPETFPDIVDIAGMDYSPAKRKPPIHN